MVKPGLDLLARMLAIIGPILLVLLPFLSESNAASFKLDSPVAICKGSSSDVFVLDTWGVVHRLRQTQNSLVEFSHFSLEDSPRPIDMSYVLLDGKESLIVTQILFGHSSVTRYSLDGKMLQSWNLRNLGSGIDFNVSDRSAYLSTSDSNEIYKLDLSGKDVSYVLQVHQARKLSALVLDSNKNILYVADVAEGAIYACQMSTKSCKMFVSGLGAPTALYLDQQSAQLYVADGARRAVFTVSTNSAKPVVTNFASSPLKSPSGVILIPGVGVVVSDYGASCVYLFSSQGTVVSKLP